MDNKNYYDLLNVRPNASCQEIHASYIRLLEEYKTDLNKTEEEDYFLKMAAKMNIAELEKAYAILSDAEKRKAYKLQEDGMDTVDANICLGHLADERDYGVGAQILRELGVHKMRLLTNNPVKRVGLEAYGLEIVENVPVETVPNPYNERYLRTKKERMGHTLHFNK